MSKQSSARRNARADHRAGTRQAYQAARRRILATQDICGICGKPVNKNLRPPDPGSPTVDHIIPLAKGGDPLDPDNLQLAHRRCNQLKSAKIYFPLNRSVSSDEDANDPELNRNLPLSFDWKNYRSSDE